MHSCTMPLIRHTKGVNLVKKLTRTPFLSCWKWPSATFPVTSVCTRWPSYLSPRSAGWLTARTLNSLGNSRRVLRVILSRYTRAKTCRPRAVIGRKRPSLRSSRQWARTAQSPVRGRVTDRARHRPSGHYYIERRCRAPEQRWRVRTPKRPVQNDVWQYATTWRFRTTRRLKTTWQSVQRGRGTTCPSTPPLSRWSSRRAKSPSAKSPTATRKHSALLAVLRLLLRSWWLLFFFMFVALLC